MVKKSVKSIKKAFVIDTSVLIYSSQSLFSFGSKDIILPISVLSELDKHKSGNDEGGKNARIVIRTLNDLRKEGSLKDGIQINEKGGIVKVSYEEDTPVEFPEKTTDNKILGLCNKLKNQYDEVILISKDFNLLVKADSIGIKAQDFVEDSKIKQLDDLYTGYGELEVSEKMINNVYSSGIIQTNLEGLYPNQCILLKNEINSKQTVPVRVSPDCCSFIRVKEKSAWGISSRNIQQMFALDMLLNDDVELVSMTGLAGSGKTLLAVAAGFQKVIEEQKYGTVVITRPTIPIGKNSDLGFLPGDIGEKMEPWLRPIRDAAEVLFGKKGTGEDHFNDMLDRGLIKVEPLNYLRGRTLSDSFIIIDEVQNISRHEIKTILTRVGENSKIILTGDLCQIDVPMMDSVSNGLSHVVEKFKNERMSGHITLIKGERSTLATIAAEIL